MGARLRPLKMSVVVLASGALLGHEDHLGAAGTPGFFAEPEDQFSSDALALARRIDDQV